MHPISRADKREESTDLFRTNNQANPGGTVDFDRPSFGSLAEILTTKPKRGSKHRTRPVRDLHLDSG